MPFMHLNHGMFKKEDLENMTMLMEELSSGLKQYADITEDLLKKSCVTPKKTKPEFYSMERNFFSLLFLYSFFSAGIESKKRVFYVTVNQCLRGMVTGCDNILDDEYKITIDTDLPEKGYKFRSVLDIMVSDRVLFQALLQNSKGGLFDENLIEPAIKASLSSLLKSGVQEATEEDGVEGFLKPNDVIRKVHHYKTGVLFQSPWAVPLVIEGENEKFSDMEEALYNIGMGCQIMDDMVDLAMDITMKRHNYVASSIFHSKNREKLLSDIDKSCIKKDDKLYLREFPEIVESIKKDYTIYIKKGFNGLFGENTDYLKKFSFNFIEQQIGVDIFSDDRI